MPWTKPPQEVLDICDVRDTPGVTKRVLHKECSEGKDACLVVKRTDTGWVWKCHRCGNKGGVAVDKYSPKAMAEFVKEVPLKYKTDAYYKSVFLPVDSVPLSADRYQYSANNVPNNVVQWLLSNRITQDDYLSLDVHYSPWYDRLVFPIRNTTLLNEHLPAYKTIGWVGRFVGIRDKKTPKWLIKQHMPCVFHYHKYSNIDTAIVLVEDLISAYRIHKATGLSVVGLLGKNINTTLVIKIKKWWEDFNGTVIVWLDRDALKDSVTHWKKISSLGIKCKYIYTDLDPKAYDNDVIKNQLGAFIK